MTDAINPAHYEGAGGWQSIDVIEAFVPDRPHRWAALKYIFRAGKKDPAKEVEDLRKAIWWLEREIMAHDKAIKEQAIAAGMYEPTGCADDCTHPSHGHQDCQNETPSKPACFCAPGECEVDKGHTVKYVYCKKAEEAAADPYSKPWPFPHSDVDY